MYSLDINFLSDRAVITAHTPDDDGFAKAPKHQWTLKELIPAIGGGVALLLLLGGAGGYYFYLNWQKSQQQEQLNALEGQIQALQAQNQEIIDLQSQIDIARQQTTGLATVFTRILPWSAVLADIRDRIPQGIQINSIEEVPVSEVPQAQPAQPADPNAAPDPNAPPPTPPMPMIKLSGYARSYDDVNYFVLTLQRSAFFQGETVELTQASLIEEPNPPEEPEDRTTSSVRNFWQAIEEASVAERKLEEAGLPQVVEYEITMQLNDLSTLTPEALATQLQNKGTLGSVVRIETLREKGLLTEETAQQAQQQAQPDPNASPSPAQ